MQKILSPMEKIRFPESEELPEGVKEIDVKDTFGYCTELYRMLNTQSTVAGSCIFRSWHRLFMEKI